MEKKSASTLKPSEEIFREMIIAKEPAISYLCARLIGKIAFPVTDHSDFRNKLYKAIPDSKKERYSGAVSEVILNLIKSTEMPVLTMQSALEKLFCSLENEKRKKSNEPGCHCSSPTTIAMMPDFYNYERCMNKKPNGDLDAEAAWSSFCQCLWLSNSSVFECLDEIISYLRTNTE
jgi:hypothetical protein